MKIRELTEWGRIVKGVNTTADVDTNSISREAGKFGNKVDKDGRPPTLSKKVKGSKTNVLFNLGMAENKKLDEKWSDKYKRSINCNNPKGFSQKAHCAGRNKNEAQELSSVSTIYVDMDGVLADFFGDWAKLMGKDHWTKIDDISPALQKIRDTENFWLDLPLTDNAKNLLALIKDVKGEYNILSSPLPDDPNSEPHKREWIKKNLNFFLPNEVIITHDKARYATTEDGTPNILIDDYGQNIAKWEAAGGIGFKHKDHKFERTAKAIKQHMQEPVESVMESLSASDFPDTYEGVIEKYKDVYAFGTSKRTRVLGGKRLAKELYDKLGQGVNHNAYRTIHQIVFGKIKQYETQLHQKREQAGLERQSKEFAKSDMLKSFSTAKNILASILGHAMEALKQPTQQQENFADGKKKGKSRPGRVKRSGASCKGSVTSLRKKAKKYSGERGRMYHWCANMKSGRNK